MAEHDTRAATFLLLDDISAHMEPNTKSFVERLAGSEGTGVSGVDEVKLTDDDRVGVIFDEDSLVGVNMAKNEAGVDELGRERVDDNRIGMVVQDKNSGFFDDPISSSSSGKRLRPVGIRREPDGEFAPPPEQIEPAGVEPGRRDESGRFVSDDLREVDDIGRQDRTGLFDLF